MAPVVHALRGAGWAEARVLSTGQHRELLDEQLAFFEVAADRDLAAMRPDQDLTELTAALLPALDHALAEERPDLVLAQGDTTTVLTTAQRKYPEATFKMAEGYVPVENQQWDLNYLVRKRDKSLMQFINEGIRELLENGKIEEIVESYGVPFYPPFAS